MAVLVAVSAVVAGLVCLGLGAARLASLARFVPYTVIAGFLAATGYLLVIGAIGIAVGEGLSETRECRLVDGSALEVDDTAYAAHGNEFLKLAMALARHTTNIQGNLDIDLVKICVLRLIEGTSVNPGDKLDSGIGRMV